jgi:septation ring formation regulator EzrA
MCMEIESAQERIAQDSAEIYKIMTALSTLLSDFQKNTDVLGSTRKFMEHLGSEITDYPERVGSLAKLFQELATETSDTGKKRRTV